MEYLKLFESWQKGREVWCIVTKDEKYFLEEEYWMESDELLPMDDVKMQEIDDNSFTSRENAIGHIKGFIFDVLDGNDERDQIIDNFKPKKFFIGTYMMDDDSKLNI